MNQLLSFSIYFIWFACGLMWGWIIWGGEKMTTKKETNKLKIVIENIKTCPDWLLAEVKDKCHNELIERGLKNEC